MMARLGTLSIDCVLRTPPSCIDTDSPTVPMVCAPADADFDAATSQSLLHHIHPRKPWYFCPFASHCVTDCQDCLLKHFNCDCHATGTGQEHWCEQLFGKEATGHFSVCHYSPCCLPGEQLAFKLASQSDCFTNPSAMSQQSHKSLASASCTQTIYRDRP